MGAFKDQLAAFKVVALGRYHGVIREVVTEAGERLIARSPIGAPETWKSKPPKDYVPGNFVSNWNYGLMSPDRSLTALTGVRVVNYLDELPVEAGGFVHFLTNASPYGPALENGHSGQAPNGMVSITEMELPQIVSAAVQKVKS